MVLFQTWLEKRSIRKIAQLGKLCLEISRDLILILDNSLNHTPFSDHLLDETLESYMVPIILILAAYLRAKPMDSYKLTTTLALEQHLHHLRQALTTKDHKHLENHPLVLSSN